MADRVSAMIQLGGRLARSHLDAFLGVVADEALSTEWDGPSFDASEIPSEGPLSLMAHEVAGGSFRGLEAFCHDHGLTFRRTCNGFPGQWSGERLVFEGEGRARSYDITDADEVVVTLEQIRRLGSMEAIEEHFAMADIAVPALLIVEGETGRG